VSAPASEDTREGAGARPWWRDAVVYQIYVKSFADSDGDGIGDLDGVTSKLDYLVELDVDALWLNPCYPTPDCDGGYDVADYLTIGSVYGGTDALLRLLAAAHERGMRVLLDIVPNHSSTEHAWFQAALTEPPDGPHRRRFHFRDGRGPDGSEPPNNWRSTFGGPAWTRVREPDGEWGQWYLHLFAPGQPDFDWEDEAVRVYFERVLRHWFDLGVDGFRIDVAHGLVKAAGLPDYDRTGNGPSPMTNQPGVHDVFRSWRVLTDAYLPERNLVLVGEAWAPDARSTAEYIRPDELHQTFYFDLVEQPWDGARFRTSVQRGLDAVEGLAPPRPGRPAGTFAWTLNNHDVFRSVTRYGIVEPRMRRGADPHAAIIRPAGAVDVELGRRRARAALLFLLALPGSIYLYQGEELGLHEVLDLPDDVRQDPLFRHPERPVDSDPGRDGCRVPLPWSPEGLSLGFSPEQSATPWLPQPRDFAALAASVQASRTTSTLALYRAALALRRERLAGASATIEWRSDLGRDDVTAYTRGEILVAVNFGTEPFPLPPSWGPVLLRSDGGDGTVLEGSTGAWLARA
jgi:alpha-glucosidase